MVGIEKWSNERLLEDFESASIACFEDENDEGYSSWKYDVEQELLRRLNQTKGKDHGSPLI